MDGGPRLLEPRPLRVDDSKTEAVRPNAEIGDEQNVGPLGPTDSSDHRQRSVGPVDGL
jgi:hypothetical protein